MVTRRASASSGVSTISRRSLRRKPGRTRPISRSRYEYAHALLHFDVNDEAERSKREVEAEAVAYIVGRFFGLDTSGSAFYLAAWQDDDPEMIQDRLGRISSTAQEIIDVVDN